MHSDSLRHQLRALRLAAVAGLALAAHACHTPRARETPKPAAAAAPEGKVVLTPPAPVPPAPPPPEEPVEHHDAIVVAGERHSIGAPVVLWTDPGGYSAYATALHFGEPKRANPPQGLRYRPGRAVDGVESQAPAMDELAQQIDQFVLHFDVCGVSRQCFRVLHDIRGLSVHFLLDIDGTLYQTLDLRDTAWHARQANPRSIGIEIASIGAYPPGEGSPLDTWYAHDRDGVRIVLPTALGDGGVRTPGFVGRPARPGRIAGLVHGKPYEQFDFTPEQYETLEKLGAALCKLFPKLEPDAPRDQRGRVRTEALDDEEFREFRGFLGHHHVTSDKQDPGPALDWERLLEGVRSRL